MNHSPTSQEIRVLLHSELSSVIDSLDHDVLERLAQLYYGSSTPLAEGDPLSQQISQHGDLAPVLQRAIEQALRERLSQSPDDE